MGLVSEGLREETGFHLQVECCSHVDQLQSVNRYFNE